MTSSYQYNAQDRRVLPPRGFVVPFTSRLYPVRSVDNGLQMNVLTDITLMAWCVINKADRSTTRTRKHTLRPGRQLTRHRVECLFKVSAIRSDRAVGAMKRVPALDPQMCAIVRTSPPQMPPSTTSGQQDFTARRTLDLSELRTCGRVV